MRHPARADANQPAIVKALRGAGCLVEHLHEVGGGCPDLLVGWRGRWHVVEVKDGSKPPSGRKLTPKQVEWHELAARRKLPVLIVISPKDAIEQIVEER